MLLKLSFMALLAVMTVSIHMDDNSMMGQYGSNMGNMGNKQNPYSNMD
jgi:hypothetical protein